MFRSIVRCFLLFSLCVSLLSIGCYSQAYAKNQYTGSLDNIYNFKCVKNELQMQDLCEQLEQCKGFAVDTETTGLDPVSCDCIGMSICTQEGESYYIPFGHQVEGEQLTVQQVAQYLKPIFENKKIEKYLQNAPFDMIFLYTIGIDLQGLFFDTKMAAQCMEPLLARGLKDLSIQYFNETMISFKEAVFDNGYKDFSELPLDLATRYAAADAHQTLKLTHVMQKEIVQKGLQDLYDARLALIEIDYKNLKKKICRERKDIIAKAVNNILYIKSFLKASEKIVKK